MVLEDSLFCKEYLSQATSAASFQKLNKRPHLLQISNNMFSFVASRFGKNLLENCVSRVFAILQ